MRVTLDASTGPHSDPLRPARVDPAAVEVAFRGHAAVLDGLRDGLTGIALDGKTLRGRFDRFQDQKAL